MLKKRGENNQLVCPRFKYNYTITKKKVTNDTYRPMVISGTRNNEHHDESNNDLDNKRLHDWARWSSSKKSFRVYVYNQHHCPASQSCSQNLWSYIKEHLHNVEHKTFVDKCRGWVKFSKVCKCKTKQEKCIHSLPP